MATLLHAPKRVEGDGPAPWKANPVSRGSSPAEVRPSSKRPSSQYSPTPYCYRLCWQPNQGSIEIEVAGTAAILTALSIAWVSSATDLLTLSLI